MCQSVMAENYVTCTPMALDRKLLFEKINISLPFIRPFATMFSLVPIVKYAVALGPDCEPSTVGWHVIDVAYHTKMKAVSVSVAVVTS